MADPGELPQRLAKRLRVSGVLIALGLAIEAATLYSGHPLAFVVYLAGGASLVGAGVLAYLWAIFQSL